ncbi:hypothetical protein UFOVP233_13 [uncultured Caudovirales phage]|uniref:Uncharacterized protein n=1 Tax=uncultured Caudovirales phage TaxID=2100421 RepID=A0A6J7WYW3_9CAUD|nr:hypothetical protein UFOVP233_13 [uncultured Caudovirales phage]
MTEKPEPNSTPSPIAPSMIRLMGDGVVASDDPEWVGKAIPAGAAFYSEEWCGKLLENKDGLIAELSAEIDRLHQVGGNKDCKDGCDCSEPETDEIQEFDETKNLNIMRRMFGQMLLEMPVGAVLDAMCISLSYLTIRDIHAVFSAVGVDIKADIGSKSNE